MLKEGIISKKNLGRRNFFSDVRQTDVHGNLRLIYSFPTRHHLTASMVARLSAVIRIKMCFACGIHRGAASLAVTWWSVQCTISEFNPLAYGIHAWPCGLSTLGTIALTQQTHARDICSTLFCNQCTARIDNVKAHKHSSGQVVHTGFRFITSKSRANKQQRFRTKIRNYARKMRWQKLRVGDAKHLR